MSVFPAGLDSFINPGGNSSTIGHAQEHTDANNAIAALEAKVGVDGSAVPSSLDYKVKQLQNAQTPGNSIISDEAVTGLQNGTNLVFTTAQTYIGGSLDVYINGLKQTRGTHVTETNPAIGIFTLDTAPKSSDLVRVNYLHAANTGSLDADTVDGYHALGIFNKLYPVGSVYINATDATNPGTLLGFGTWVAWGIGKAIVGIDTSQTEFATAEQTGGEKVHLLTIAEMPSHTHSFIRRPTWYSGEQATGDTIYSQNSTTALGAVGATDLNTTGGGGSHNNLQPYQVGYVWKRTA